ncbi:hypothetical protein AD998_08235 [bacterium 336/3]|nr:hypothetical protein AD998_08235 [bacterium 336/3]
MKYNTEWLEEQEKQGKTLNYLFFWGHTVPTDGGIGKTCMSQWYPIGFSENGVQYATAEHYMMAQKAILFKDEAILPEILSAKTPNDAKKLGRKVKNFDEATWLKHRYEFVKQGNILKFSQTEVLKGFLLGTGYKIIVEASPYDKIWGIGLSQDAPDAQHFSTWKGLNLLGFALMEVRDELLK